MVEQHGLRAHHVADCNDRKIKAPWFACFRIRRRWPGGAHASTQNIRADHKIALGIDRPAGADHRFPPARFPRYRMHTGAVLVSCEGMTNQHGIRTLRVECAIGLEGNLEWREIDAGVEFERLISAKMGDQRLAGLIHLAW